MKEILSQQYQYVLSSREVLLEYCEGISQEHFLHENPGFANASIHYLLLHIANTYLFWIGQIAFCEKVDFYDYKETFSLDDIKEAFIKVNALMERFFETDFPSEIAFEIRTNKGITTPLKLCTHVTTHEYHHKGQILSMSRHLGYIPVDTDVMR